MQHKGSSDYCRIHTHIHTQTMDWQTKAIQMKVFKGRGNVSQQEDLGNLAKIKFSLFLFLLNHITLSLCCIFVFLLGSHSIPFVSLFLKCFLTLCCSSFFICLCRLPFLNIFRPSCFSFHITFPSFLPFARPPFTQSKLCWCWASFTSVSWLVSGWQMTRCFATSNFSGRHALIVSPCHFVGMAKFKLLLMSANCVKTSVIIVRLHNTSQKKVKTWTTANLNNPLVHC